MPGKKQGSSQVAWALLTEGVTSARLEAHRLRFLLNRALALVEKSDQRELLYRAAGDLIVAAPKRLESMEIDLDRVALALSKMGEEFLDARLPLSDKTLVNESIESVSIMPIGRQRTTKLVQRYFHRQSNAAAMAATQLFREGTSPDEGPWRGGAPVIQAGFFDPKVVNKAVKSLPRGTLLVSARLLFGAPFKSGAGVHADSYLLQRYAQAYPNDLRFLKYAFLDAVERLKPDLIASIQEWCVTQPEKIVAAVFGYHAVNEYAEPDGVEVEIEIGNEVQYAVAAHTMWVPFTVEVRFTTTRGVLDKTARGSVEVKDLHSLARSTKHKEPELAAAFEGALRQVGDRAANGNK